MSLPDGFYPVQQTFGLDQYRTLQNPYRELWRPYFPNDDPSNSNWPVFIEAVAIPRKDLPRGTLEGVGELLDIWPRKVVYYGGPISRYYAEQYRRVFENWAHSQGMAADTAVVPVQPNSSWFPHPSTDFGWYIAHNEQRPQKTYRLIRPYEGQKFHWVDCSFDTWKYKNFHRANPTLT